jgi:hypothetical protein
VSARSKQKNSVLNSEKRSVKRETLTEFSNTLEIFTKSA